MMPDQVNQNSGVLRTYFKKKKTWSFKILGHILVRVTASHDIIPASLESGQKLKRVKLITPVERVIQNNILKIFGFMYVTNCD